MKSGRLSPTAAPFHPTYEPVNLVIFNDGVPSMTFSSEMGRSEALHGIDDVAIDESFPPTAQDAYEMEAAEHYCAMLADLYLLEQREERARNFAYLPARWEARRQMGLQGRPRPPMKRIAPVVHSNGPSGAGCSSLVTSSAHHHRSSRQQRRSLAAHQLRNRRSSRRNQARTLISNIQQPRKQS